MIASCRPARATQQNYFKKAVIKPQNMQILSLFPGSIRLPKAAKTPLKIHPLVRLPLATIVKDLGMVWGTTLDPGRF